MTKRVFGVLNVNIDILSLAVAHFHVLAHQNVVHVESTTASNPRRAATHAAYTAPSLHPAHAPVRVKTQVRAGTRRARAPLGSCELEHEGEQGGVQDSVRKPGDVGQ